MRQLAHIIHPVEVHATSDLNVAQPITFTTMRTAQEFAADRVDVALYTVKYHDENPDIPEGFREVPALERSIADIRPFKKRRKLAVLKDILDRLYESASDAEFLIYTNVDIALMPYFYLTVDRLIDIGSDAFAINRRTISDRFVSSAEIPRMYAEIGDPHPGWDCFVFKREVYPKYELGTACIGTGWIGRTLLTNMACFASQFHVFTDLHASFHIGNSKTWKDDTYNDYILHNKKECRKILIQHEKDYGCFDRNKIPGKFMKILQDI